MADELREKLVLKMQNETEEIKEKPETLKLFSILENYDKTHQKYSEIEYQKCTSCGDGTKLHQNLTATSQWIHLIHNNYIHFTAFYV